MTSKIREIEDDEIVNISGTDYVRIPVGMKKQIGIINADGTQKSNKIKRAVIEGKFGTFLGVWGEFQSK